MKPRCLLINVAMVCSWTFTGAACGQSASREAPSPRARCEAVAWNVSPERYDEVRDAVPRSRDNLDLAKEVRRSIDGGVVSAKDLRALFRNSGARNTHLLIETALLHGMLCGRVQTRVDGLDRSGKNIELDSLQPFVRPATEKCAQRAEEIAASMSESIRSKASGDWLSALHKEIDEEGRPYAFARFVEQCSKQ